MNNIYCSILNLNYLLQRRQMCIFRINVNARSPLLKKQNYVFNRRSINLHKSVEMPLEKKRN